ncbi:sulfotransferase family protein [Nocardioides terrisoli]|uniref:sulfotransferase family protein n=1 Tax=Nocardioides terrisoli TaxID=3388267 RepID=UPI00287B5D30|nr:sulfotransferase [Nocardioides marmorisolisilvae]
MTTLSGGAGASTTGDLVTLQCDVCCPPRLATSTLAGHHESGWTLRADGSALDVCPMCVRRLAPQKWTPRASQPKLAHDAGGARPNFFVIGAAKAATTTLHGLVGRHPDVAMATGKELLFFQDPDRASWRGHYRAMFDPTALVRGESSTAYTRAPFVPDVAANIAESVPEARLVYLVRDPIDRAVSSYVEERMHSNDLRGFDEAFADVDPAHNPYVAGSCYAHQLAAYLEHFSRDQMLVLDMAELATRPEQTLRRVWAFAGVDPDVEVVGLDERLNTREEKREYSAAGTTLRRSPLVRLLYALPDGPRERLLAPVRRRLSQPIPRPEVLPELRARLEAVFAPDVAELRRISDLELAGWSV